MSSDAILTIALDVAFFAIFGFTLVDYVRHRERVRLVIMLVFGSVTVVLAAAPIRAVIPALGPVLSFLSLPALLAQPVLVLWLASFVRPIPRRALLGAAAAFLALIGGVVAIVAGDLASGGTDGRTPALVAIALGLLAYFVIVEAGAAIAFALAARDRAGASRSRLVTASLAAALFGAD